MRVDTFWWMRYDHHCSIFYDTICHELVSHSDTFGQDFPDRVHDGGRPDTTSMIEVPDLRRGGTRIYVLMRSSRTDTLCCDRRIRLWSRCLSRCPSRIPTIWATIGPERYIYSPTDYWLHCVFQGLPRLTSRFDMSWYKGRDKSTINTTIQIVALIVILGTPHNQTAQTGMTSATICTYTRARAILRKVKMVNCIHFHQNIPLHSAR